MPYLGRSPGSGVRSRFIYAATSGQTSFSGNDSNSVSLAYEDTLYMDVYQNGVLLKPVTDYAATTGTSVVLTTGATTDDVVEMIVYDTFAVADTVSASNGGTFAGDVAVTGNVTTTGTVEPAGDTSAGDNAAIGFTSAEGLILTGQGSTSDITVKNDADATVFSVPTGTDDILFPDSAKILMGAGSDLQIYHDGSDSYIAENSSGATGDLKILGNNIKLRNSGDSIDYIATNASSGAITLSHDGSSKFATTSTGVSITGGFTATDGCTITTADNDAQFILKSTDADSDAGPFIDLQRDSGSPADNDFIGKIRFAADDDGGNVTEFAQIQSQIIDASNGSEDGTLQIRTTVAGSVGTPRVDFHPTETVFNEGSNDLDFRVESNGKTAAIFVDANNDRVGIGTAGPDVPFQVSGEISGSLMRIHNDGSDTNRGGLEILSGKDDSTGTTNNSILIKDGDGSLMGTVSFSGGTVTYGTFTAYHPCILPDADNNPDSPDNAYPYGTLLETTSLAYSQKNGADTERGIRYNVRKTQTANSRAVLGAYGGTFNKGSEGDTNSHLALVLGDGHILCNNSGGNIEVGDGICSSAAEGIGQKATASPSMIIGIAQEAVTFADNTETKLVAVQYGLQQFTPWS